MSTSFIIASINKDGNVLSTYYFNKDIQVKGSINNSFNDDDYEELIEFRHNISLNPVIPIVNDLGKIEKYPTVEEWMSSIKDDIIIHVFINGRWFDTDREAVQTTLDDEI